MNMEFNEEQLSDEIAALRFALIELTLFLDTHPSDGEALALFSEYNDKLLALSEQYVNLFGPLTVQDVTGKNGWTWGLTPMPFEGGR